MCGRSRSGAKRSSSPRSAPSAPRTRFGPCSARGAAWPRFPTTIPAVWTRRFEELLRSFTWQEFWSSGRVRHMNRQTLRQLVASWKPRSGARRRSSFWSAPREPMRNLPTATIAARDRQKLWCVLRPVLYDPARSAPAGACNRRRGSTGAECARPQSQADRRRPQFSAASLCGRPGACCHCCHPTFGRE